MKPAVEIVRVDLGDRAYSIEIGRGNLTNVGSTLRRIGEFKKATVITDDVVAPLYADRLGQSLLAAGIEYSLFVLPNGEKSKSLSVAAELYDELAASRHGRDQPIVALGGGVVGDVAGFVAATWQRGVPWLACPTTLEAMIDAGIGGKTAVNHPTGKNLIGAFHQPLGVCCDVDCLGTLSERDYRAALAESVKHAVIAGGDFVAWHQAQLPAIRRRDLTIAVELVRRNCAIKASIVSTDEREKATDSVGRAALNFGHTIGHAIELASQYALRHGEAVALGIIAELELAVRLCGFPDADRITVERLLRELVAQAPPPLQADQIIPLLIGDKKVRSGQVRFAVPETLGRMRWLVDPQPCELEAAIARIYES